MSEYEGFFIEGIEQWSQFFQSCNWYTFHPLMFEVEDERNMGGFEITLIVLGLGFRARWNYRETETVREIKRRAEEILDSDFAPRLGTSSPGNETFDDELGRA